MAYTFHLQAWEFHHQNMFGSVTYLKGMGCQNRKMHAVSHYPCLKPFIAILSETLKHNFIPGLLTLGSTALMLHYQLLIEKLRYCPIPLAFGPSGTGKTTAIECGMSLIGAENSRLYSKVTREKVYELCAESSGLPLAVDDPHSKSDNSKLLVDLYNGKKGGSIVRG